MDSHETTNQKIAAILGWEIVPKHKENSGTFVAGKTYLLGHRDAAGRLRITHPERRSRDWSPATDPADALDALIAMSDKIDQRFNIIFEGEWFVWFNEQDQQCGETLSEAACRSILAAEDAHA